jgi:hypothetical protein
MKVLPDGARYQDVAPFVRKNQRFLPKRWKEPHMRQRMNWRHGAVNLRNLGNDLQADVDRILKIASRLAAYLARNGQMADIVVLDIGNKNDYHVHLHFISYGPWIKAKDYERWHRSLDCTTPGCRHEPGDKTHCTGSFEGHLDFVDDPREITKYVCEFPKIDRSTGEFNRRQVELRIAAHLATYNRHRIRPHGFAQKGCVESIEREAALVREGRVCPYCGGELYAVAVGYWSSGSYRWEAVQLQ